MLTQLKAQSLFVNSINYTNLYFQVIYSQILATGITSIAINCIEQIAINLGIYALSSEEIKAYLKLLQQVFGRFVGVQFVHI